MKGQEGTVDEGGNRAPGSISEIHLEVPRRARLAVLGSREEPPRELWIVLHGYRQLARRFLRRFRPVEAPGRLVVAPEGHARFYLEGNPGPHRGGDPVGASWMTREDRETEIVDYVRYLDRVLTHFDPSARAALTVVGFSQGVHTAARWVALGEEWSGARLAGSRLILWGASLPGDLPRGAVGRFGGLGEIILVRGEADELRGEGGEEREERWLREAGVEYRVVTHPGGHRVEEAPLTEIEGC